MGKFIKNILYYTGRGVPSEIMARTNILTPLQESDIPNAREAKTLYETVYSRRLTEENPFVEDRPGGN